MTKLTLASYHCRIFTPSAGCAIHRLFILKRWQRPCPIRLSKEKVYKIVTEPYYNTHYSPDTKLLIHLAPANTQSLASLLIFSRMPGGGACLFLKTWCFVDSKFSNKQEGLSKPHPCVSSWCPTIGESKELAKQVGIWSEDPTILW
jgi:hypothetical protein